MSTISCTIGGNSVSVLNHSFTDTKALEVRSTLQLTVVDASGTAVFLPDQPIVLSDSVTGTIFSGYIATDAPQKLSPDPTSTTILHVITCKDNQDLLGKRTNSKNYLNWYAGDAIVDMVQSTLAAEGVTVAGAQQHVTTTSDWNTGTLSNVTAYSTVGDGDLELTQAGTAITITETSASDFSSGTLTNVTATSSGLVPTSSAAIQLIGTSGANGGRLIYKIWIGSQTIGSNDVFNYEIWINSSSPSGEVAMDFTCSDGTTLSSTTGVDGQGYTGTPSNDISGLASGKWYSRAISLSSINGKTISFVTVNISATKQGTYTVFFRNVYLSSASGSPFFSTTLQQNPPVQLLVGNFVNVSLAVVTTYGVATTGVLPSYVRYSTAASINAAQILRSSLFSYLASLVNNAAASFRSSFDGGITFQAVTNNTNFSGLLAGASIASKTILLEETLTLGTDPTIAPALISTSTSIQPSFVTSARTDFTKTYSTSSDWNSGTLTNTVVIASSWPLADHAITLNGYTRAWLDGIVSSQTAWVTGNGYVGPYNQAMKLQPDTSTIDCKSQLGFAGNWQNFTAAVDIAEFKSSQYAEAGFVYRTTHWDAQNNTYAYTATMTLNGAPDFFVLAKGSNSSSPSSTRIATPANPVSGGTNHRLQIIINGNNHQLFMDGIQYLNVNDSSFTATGGVGLRCYNAASGNTAYARFANFGIAATTSGTWLSQVHSLTSVGTYGTSTIVWRNDNPSNDAVILVESTINGGTSWQTVTNGGAIPNLTAGQSLSGISVQIRITLSTIAIISLPQVSGLRITVSNQYSASGTRSTAPLGIDTAVRANQSGWGTAFDGQTWTKTGTGTDAVSSDELTITNTTGDVHEVLGSTAGTDLDGTVRFQLSASTITAGMELRYVDSTHYYRLAASTTALSIIKHNGGSTSTLATSSVSLSTATWYYLRFRIVGSGPADLWGRVWQGGTLEPTTWNVIGTD